MGSQLLALSQQRSPVPYEVVIADNGSLDGSKALAQLWGRRDSRFRLVDASARRGPAAARNHGVRFSVGELLAFCDADDLVQPGWLAALIRGLKEADVVGGAFDLWSLNGRPPQAALPASTHQLGFLPAGLGANLAVRREAFEASGGFDETLLVGEDVDLCWRLQLSGRRFATAHDAVVAKRSPHRDRDVFVGAYRYGKSGAVLYRRYRSAGARPDLHKALRSWARLGLSVTDLFDPSARAAWMHGAGMRLGRLVGSARERVLFP